MSISYCRLTLTTAAGIWAVGGIGLAIGAGLYLVGTTSAVLVGLILASERLFKIEAWMARRVAEDETKDLQ